MLAVHFMTYKRVHERGWKGITKIYKIMFGEEKNEENIWCVLCSVQMWVEKYNNIANN